jgi:hypothetical protein
MKVRLKFRPPFFSAPAGQPPRVSLLPHPSTTPRLQGPPIPHPVCAPAPILCSIPSLAAIFDALPNPNRPHTAAVTRTPLSHHFHPTTAPLPPMSTTPLPLTSHATGTAAARSAWLSVPPSIFGVVPPRALPVGAGGEFRQSSVTRAAGQNLATSTHPYPRIFFCPRNPNLDTSPRRHCSHCHLRGRD